jgi:hypothetical protein
MTVEPFKIVGQLIACEKNENNEIIGERVVAEMVLYAPQFGELEQRVNDAWPDIVAAFETTNAVPGPPAARPSASGGEKPGPVNSP